MARRKIAREIWRAIPGFDGYEASNLGRIRSLDRTVIRGSSHGGMRPRKYRGRMLNQSTHSGGYLLAHVGPGRSRTRYVHRLVLLTFEGPAPVGHEVGHKDNNPKNNRLSNLRYITRSENEFNKIRPEKKRCPRCGRMIRCYDPDHPPRNL